MEAIFNLIHNELQKGNDLELVSIVDSSGSAPRGSGAHMLIGAQGYLGGTIGGGSIEYKSISIAGELLANKVSELKHFNLLPNDDLGMLCGGKATVLYTFLNHEDTVTKDVFQQIVAKSDQHVEAWLLTKLVDETEATLGFYSEDTQFIGIDADMAYLTIKPNCWTADGATYFVEPISQSDKVYIYGAGHVAEALVPVLHNLNFYTVVLDDRTNLLTREHFATADELKLVDFSKDDLAQKLTAQDYGLVMTRSHEADYQMEVQLLNTPAFYLGIIGSRYKISKHARRLMDEEGFTKEEVARLHWPIGLDINAETPAEIAISIAGELIKERSTQYQEVVDQKA